MVERNQLTGKEISFGNDEIIVSKTNLKGHITYANDVFLRISGYSEEEVIGEPHRLIRHPHSPRAIFKLLWDTIQSGTEVFAYVNNRAKNGDNYWVLAHVTPSLDNSGRVVGYHSNRRVPDRSVLTNKVIPLYEMLLQEEKRHNNAKAGLAASYELLVQKLAESGVEYDEFIAGLQAA
jgi:PAS domain S-box-containing protein